MKASRSFKQEQAKAEEELGDWWLWSFAAGSHTNKTTFALIDQDNGPTNTQSALEIPLSAMASGIQPAKQAFDKLHGALPTAPASLSEPSGVEEDPGLPLLVEKELDRFDHTTLSSTRLAVHGCPTPPASSSSQFCRLINDDKIWPTVEMLVPSAPQVVALTPTQSKRGRGPERSGKSSGHDVKQAA
ncbi:MAG: hypothetical protein Q9226_002188 [Calogaya cf. arnoldii]